MFAEMQPTQAEAIKRKARASRPSPASPRQWRVRPPPVGHRHPAQITEAQRLLARLDLNPGPADGKLNARTAEAIRQFERDNDLPVTGEASVSLLRQLRAATLNTTGMISLFLRAPNSAKLSLFSRFRRRVSRA